MPFRDIERYEQPRGKNKKRPKHEMHLQNSYAYRSLDVELKRYW